MDIAELQKKITDLEAKLKIQQQLYEQVRSERNLYSKNQIEAQDEIAEMRRKFKIMEHQIEQLKEEIKSKDHLLVKRHFELQGLDKEKEALKKTNSELVKNVQDSQLDIKHRVLISSTPPPKKTFLSSLDLHRMI